MSNSAKKDTLDVLVVGAGATGLTSACELARHQMKLRVIDKVPVRSDKSRALAVHARTLELFQYLGIAEQACARGNPINTFNIIIKKDPAVHLDLSKLASPYNFTLGLSQSETERILEERLQGFGHKVERNAELVDLSQDQDGVRSKVRHADGTIEEIYSSWLIATDGAHSTVRHKLNLAFDGVPYEELFLLADCHVDPKFPDNEINVYWADDGVLALFPFGQGRYRIICDLSKPEDVSDFTQEDGVEPSLAKVQALVDKRSNLPLKLSDSVWIAPFRIHRRLVQEYKHGRIFLAGDAAHIHSPVGGQGMNTGIQDAFNLVWKLAYVHKLYAQEGLLYSYQDERHPVAQAVLHGTDFATKTLATPGPIIKQIRNHVLPVLASQDFIQKRIRELISEIDVNYRESAVVKDHHAFLEKFAGPCAGDRALNATLGAKSNGANAKEESIEIYNLLRDTKHQLLLFTSTEIDDAAMANFEKIAQLVKQGFDMLIATHLVVPEDVFPGKANWIASNSILIDKGSQCHKIYGASSSCLYLLRPDGYVAYRAMPPDAVDFSNYLAQVFVGK
jgi:2-polyprenyl-6-methoxyphenol hydroxylase-like FAD-dependent oxidoreductase